MVDYFRRKQKSHLNSGYGDKAEQSASKHPGAGKTPKLLQRSRYAVRARHYSRKTERAYCLWVKRFIFFNKLRHPDEMGEKEINAFLNHLAVSRKVSASTQNQTLSAILFLYRHLLGRKIGDLGDLVRARRPKRLPEVMTRNEVKALTSHLRGQMRLMAWLM